MFVFFLMTLQRNWLLYSKLEIVSIFNFFVCESVSSRCRL